ncbi:hypothetical protein Golob_027729 [Gossypium lobatum]|uniref:Uncharacterized protein n=1 Tax=Gossypium lobatum TaxID=34289 RepID=A0A7J8NJ50_9ROSI|nr:hypothetical protein [Gossypium lobatum]
MVRKSFGECKPFVLQMQIY